MELDALVGDAGAAVFSDTFDRIHDDLRVSVTDRCNLRCEYCMPEEPVWFPRSEVLGYEEIMRLVRIAVRRGVRRVRVTGGEPLVRRDLTSLVRMLADESGIEDLSLTTNGLLLGSQAGGLADAGLSRINVSLDTLIRERYRKMTRRDMLQQALDGIRAAADAGLSPIKVNTLLLPGVNDDEVEPLVRRARDEGWELRFIEQMPLGNGGAWDRSSVVSGEQIRRRIDAVWPLVADSDQDPSAPATRYSFRDGKGRVGFIDSVSRPFCSTCSRLRLTADGQFRVCLYDDREIDLKTAMRTGATDERLETMMLEAVRAKGRGGALEILEQRRALPIKRTMHQIGG